MQTPWDFRGRVGASLLLAAAAALPCAASEVDAAITRADIERTVRKLASDDMKGRATGSAECAAAGEWLAAALKRAGLAPGGDEGTYLQHVPFVQIDYRAPVTGKAWTSAGARELVSGVDFTFSGGVPNKKQRLEVRVVRSADEMPRKPDDSLALYLEASSSERRKWLGEERGAGFGLIIGRGNEAPGAAADNEPPRSRQLNGESARSTVANVVVHGSLLAGLRDGSIKALQIEAAHELKKLPAFNVVGVIRGVGTPSEPALAEQAIVFSAHYDHIGVDTRRASDAEGKRDVVRNGADDDASGCAAVLELAEAFAAGPKPARTLIFFFATGEEIGLVGTHHYINHPLVPLERTAANLNFEMIGRPDELVGGPGKLWLTGFELSNLGPAFQSLGLAIASDGRPEQNFFQRSDNYAFAVKGVVAQTLSSYNLHKDYHAASDEADTLDYAHMESAIRAAYEGSKALADGRVAPAWLEGKNPKR